MLDLKSGSGADFFSVVSAFVQATDQSSSLKAVLLNSHSWSPKRAKDSNGIRAIRKLKNSNLPLAVSILVKGLGSAPLALFDLALILIHEQSKDSTFSAPKEFRGYIHMFSN
jgi:hypothetical protein